MPVVDGHTANQLILKLNLKGLMMSKFSMDFSKLLDQINSVSTTKKEYSKDENFWKLTKDKAGNAAAVIRFLPSKNIDDFPFVRMYKHSFKDESTGRWYIENSRTTIGGQDMVSTVNRELWNSGLDENKKLSSLRKRKLSYIVNILVVKDLGNPDNNGKVFKYAFGSKIWDKIVAAAKPDEALGEEPIMAFDPINGADFLLKMQFSDATKQFNYDASRFNGKKALCDGNDDEIEKILNQCFDIQAEIAPDKFKTEEELADKFMWVTGMKDSKAQAAKPEHAAEDAELKKLVKEEKKTPPPMKPMPADSDDDSAFFASLIED